MTFYYGAVRDATLHERRPSLKTALKHGQVRYWGLRKADPEVVRPEKVVNHKVVFKAEEEKKHKVSVKQGEEKKIKIEEIKIKPIKKKTIKSVKPKKEIKVTVTDIEETKILAKEIAEEFDVPIEKVKKTIVKTKKEIINEPNKEQKKYVSGGRSKSGGAKQIKEIKETGLKDISFYAKTELAEMVRQLKIKMQHKSGEMVSMDYQGRDKNFEQILPKFYKDFKKEDYYNALKNHFK